MTLALEHLSVQRGGRAILSGVSLSLRRGELTCLVGPNGAGKTSLMRAALGLLPFSGVSNLAGLAEAERARMAGWLPRTAAVRTACLEQRAFTASRWRNSLENHCLRRLAARVERLLGPRPMAVPG